MIGRKTTGSLATLSLLSISGLHVYWARGGKRFATNAVPSRRGEPTMEPSPTATYAVAGLLGTAAFATLLSIARIGGRLPRILAAGAGLVFLLRAMGDFRLIGFFKKERSTDFAKLERKCLHGKADAAQLRSDEILGSRHHDRRP